MEAVDIQELKRYELATKDEGYPYMPKSEFGDYVLHADHLAVVESLRKQLEEANEARHFNARMCVQLQSELTALRSQQSAG